VASTAIVANNGFLIAHLNGVMGTSVTWRGVAASLGVAGTLNIAGRQVFIEGAKALAWGTGSLWALVGLSALGASTAALQTYVIGLIALEIAKSGGEPLDATTTATVFDSAKASLDGFMKEMKNKGLKDPGVPPVEAQAVVESTTPAPEPTSTAPPSSKG
jgi:hypothetical protein